MDPETMAAEIQRKLDTDSAETRRRMSELDAAQRDLESRLGTDAEEVRYFAPEGKLRAFSANGLPGFLDSAPRSPIQLEIQETAARRALVQAFQRARGAEASTKLTDARLEDAFRRLPRNLQTEQARASIFGNVSGSGQDLLPTVVLPRLEAALRAPSGIAGLFRTEQLPAGGSFSLPTRTGLPRAYKGSVPTIVDPASAELSTYGTSALSIGSEVIRTSVQIAEEAAEDMILAMMPFIEADLLASLAYSEDDAILNGDTAGTHQDTLAGWNPGSVFEGTTGTGTSIDHRKLWMGLRAEAFDAGAAGTLDMSATQTFAGMGALTSLLDTAVVDRWSVENSAYIFPSKLLMGKIGGWSEFVSNEKIVNAVNASGINGFGGMVPPGAKGRMNGAGVYTTPFSQMDQAATGLYAGSGSYGSVVAVDRMAYMRFVRAGPLVRYELDVRNGTVTLVAAFRTGFRKVVASAKRTCAVGYKWSL